MPYKHGLCGTKIYAVWLGMIGRCYNPKNHKYHRYGGRGIKVCERWRNSPAAFYEDMGDPPSPRLSIDRYPDNDGDYCPENCRWATFSQQARNRSDSRSINVGGVIVSVADAAQNAGLSTPLVRQRIDSGWDPSLAIKIPVNGRRNGCAVFELDGESRSLLEWSAISGVDRTVISARLAIGWNLRDAIFLPTGTRLHFRNSAKKNHLITRNGVTKSLVEWSEISGVKATTIRARLKRGCSPEESIPIQ